LKQESDGINFCVFNCDIANLVDKILPFRSIDLVPVTRPIDDGLGLQFCLQLWVLLQEFPYHIIERGRAYPQAVGIDKQAGHDEYVTLVFVTGLIDIDELHAVSSLPGGPG
jgi:hypothetical protein